MKTLIGGLLLAIFLSCEIAGAQEGALACNPVQASNNPGDVIHGDFCVTNFGYHDETFHMFASGGETFGNWSGPDNHCFHGQITATDFNDTIWARWGGDGAGWQAYCAVTGVDRLGGGRREVLRGTHKDQLHAIGNGLEITMGIMAIGAGKCPWQGCKETLTLVGFGMYWLAEQLKAVDPFDPDYGTPYEPVIPEPSDFGLDWDNSGDGNQDNTNYFLWRAVRFIAYGMAANISINRANSCREVGNEDCFNWQADRAQYFLRLLGETANDAAYFLDQLGWAFYGYFNPELDGNGYLADAFFNAADQMRQSYDTLSQVNY